MMRPLRPYLLCFALLATASSATAQDALWEPTSGPAVGSVSRLEEGPGGMLYAVAGGHVYRSMDGGRSWEDTPVEEIFSIVVTTGGHVFAASGYMCFEECYQAGGVYRSVDGGDTWEALGLSGVIVYDLLPNAGGGLFAALYTRGIAYLEEEHASWEPVLSGHTVYDLALDSHGHLLASASGLGLLRSTVPAVALDMQGAPAPPASRVGSRFPNPFRESAQIPFTLAVPAQVRMEVYDVAGRCVRVLLDERRVAGTHSVSFQAKGLPSGLYLYRLSGAGSTQTGKLLLQR